MASQADVPESGPEVSRSSAPARRKPSRPETGGDATKLKLLTVAEVAELMRVSKMTVYRLVHGGGLPAVRIGRSFRVPEQAVNDYLRDAYIEAG
jgi:excisionase family DNA binding protein